MGVELAGGEVIGHGHVVEHVGYDQVVLPGRKLLHGHAGVFVVGHNPGGRIQAQLRLGDCSHGRVYLHDLDGGLGILPFEVDRHGVPAAAEEERSEVRPALGLVLGRFGEDLGVAVDEGIGIADDRQAMHEVIELDELDRAGGKLDLLDLDAVVLRLDAARAEAEVGLQGIGEQPDGRQERQRRSPPPGLVGVPQEEREGEQDEAGEQDDVAGAQEGDEHKAGEVDAEDAAGGRDGIEAPDDATGRAEGGEGLLAGQRRDHAEEAAGQEEQPGVQGEGLGNDGEVA